MNKTQKNIFQLHSFGKIRNHMVLARSSHVIVESFNIFDLFYDTVHEKFQVSVKYCDNVKTLHQHYMRYRTCEDGEAAWAAPKAFDEIRRCSIASRMSFASVAVGVPAELAELGDNLGPPGDPASPGANGDEQPAPYAWLPWLEMFELLAPASSESR